MILQYLILMLRYFIRLIKLKLSGKGQVLTDL